MEFGRSLEAVGRLILTAETQSSQRRNFCIYTLRDLSASAVNVLSRVYGQALGSENSRLLEEGSEPAGAAAGIR